MDNQWTQSLALRKVVGLAILGLFWHVLEMGFALYLGWSLPSSAMLGFGLDSGVEMLAGSALLMGIFARHRFSEQRVSRVIAATFVIVAGLIVFDALDALMSGNPDLGDSKEMAFAIALAVFSLCTMYPLAWLKSRAARRLHSDSARAESRQTMLCGHMSVVVLLGLLGQYWGWWWLDPVAALVIASLALWEAWGSWQGEQCGCHVHLDPSMDYRRLIPLWGRWLTDRPSWQYRVWINRWYALSIIASALVFSLMMASLVMTTVSLALLGLWAAAIVWMMRIRRQTETLIVNDQTETAD